MLKRACYREQAEEIARPSPVASDPDRAGKVPRCGADLAYRWNLGIDEHTRMLRLKDLVVSLTVVTSGCITFT